MRTVTTTTKVYRYDELTDPAKERAREWWRDCEREDGGNWWTEFTLGDFQLICRILGVRLGTHGPQGDTCVWWSGFGLQGDGASFAGQYAYAEGSAARIREFAPQDETLHQIADDLAKLQRRFFYRLRADIGCGRGGGTYCHEGTMYLNRCWIANDGETDAGTEPEQELLEIMRRLARWLYRQLETEYEYRMSDDEVEETLIANEYEFTEDGRRYRI